MEPAKWRLVATELMTRLWLRLLTIGGTFYPDFEDHLWRQLYEENNMEAKLCSILNIEMSIDEVSERYYDYIRGMFAKSNKTREDFYDDMLIEAGIEKELGCFEFGKKAMDFWHKATESVHRDHLLVYYAVELYLQAYAAVNPKSVPISDENLETIYKHFEGRISFENTFEKYTKDDSHFKYSARRQLIPSMD